MASQSLTAGVSPCSAQAEHLSLQGGGSHAAEVRGQPRSTGSQESCAYVACRPSDTELNPQRHLRPVGVLLFYRVLGAVKSSWQRPGCRPLPMRSAAPPLQAAGRRVLACALIATAGDTSTRTAQDFSHPRPTRHQSADLAQGHGERRQIRAIVGGDVAKDSEAPADRRSVAGEPPLDQLVAVLGRAPTCRSSAASKARDGVEAVAERGTRQGLPPVVSGEAAGCARTASPAAGADREGSGHRPLPPVRGRFRRPRR
jgi:hypothetical protein